MSRLMGNRGSIRAGSYTRRVHGEKVHRVCHTVGKRVDSANTARIASVPITTRTTDRDTQRHSVGLINRDSTSQYSRFFGGHINVEWCEILCDGRPLALDECVLDLIKCGWIAISIVWRRRNIPFITPDRL